MLQENSNSLSFHSRLRSVAEHLVTISRLCSRPPTHNASSHVFTHVPCMARTHSTQTTAWPAQESRKQHLSWIEVLRPSPNRDASQPWLPRDSIGSASASKPPDAASILPPVPALIAPAAGASHTLKCDRTAP